MLAPIFGTRSKRVKWVMEFPKSCQSAAHNLKIHFNFLLMILHKKVTKMFRRVFSLIKKICFVIQIHEFLQSLTRTNMLFRF